MNIVPFMDKFPIGYQLSACPLVPMIKLLKRRIIRYMMSCFFFFFFFFFLFFFCKQVFLCVFKRVSTQQYQVGTVCAAGFFFLRDHRRTSPFPNLFKILLDFGTELLLFPTCFISECSVFFFFFFFFFLYFIFAVFKAEIPIFHTTPPRHTCIFKPCTVLRVHTFKFKYQVHTRHRVAPRLLMKVKSRFNCDIM